MENKKYYKCKHKSLSRVLFIGYFHFALVSEKDLGPLKCNKI